ncbi:MAG: diaminopimelate epimerase [Candidatus Saganbacteria bacterium]|nr:diaminopimelate epimerase [Candidatus Saganbacteria bacterium]
MQFVKMQGTGNDFVLVDAGAQDMNGIDLASFSKEICDRHYGAGADGVILVLPSVKANFKMRVINPDGSEAEMCGNGIRCFARYVWEKSEDKKEVISVETLAGIKIPAVIVENGDFIGVEVDMGVPEIIALQEQLIIEGIKYKINKVSMGNPHCVIFADNIENIEISKIGPIIENLPQFPGRTNVEFAKVINKKEIELKVWERGAGETLACGTGACAAAVAAASNDLTDKKVTVHLPGGALNIEWADDSHVIMRGPAEKVFEGVYSLK